MYLPLFAYLEVLRKTNKTVTFGEKTKSGTTPRRRVLSLYTDS